MTQRIGIIGAGIMGADHTLTLHRFVSGATVELVADLDAARATVAADAVGARSTSDPISVISDPSVDAVVIASHDSTHAALVRACLDAAKPVLCEKPLAPTPAECLDVVAAEKAAVGDGPGLVSLGFMRRFDPGYLQLRQAVVGGELGRPLMIHSVGRGVRSGPGADDELLITGSAVHDFDIVPWLLGAPVVEVSWHAPQASSLADFQDPQMMLLRTADGALSTVENFLNARYGYDIRCEIVCETGSVTLAEPARVRRDHELSHGFRYAGDWRPRFADAYRLELQAWVDGLNTGSPTELATAADGLQASAVCAAVIASMRDGGRTARVSTQVR